MSRRGPKLVLSILLLFSAISLASNAYQNLIVQAAPTISLNPTAGPRGTVVTVSGSGFAAGDAGSYNCLSSTPLPDIVSLGTCTFSAGGTMTGSFTVLSTVTPYIGAHSIKATGSTSDFASATFTVTGPTIALNPNSGPISTAVTVTGSGFDLADACIPATSSTPGPIVTGLGSCTFSGGVLSESFTVNPGASPGVYTVTVDGGGNFPDTAQATFTVVTPGPTISLNPTSGPPGTPVTITGSGFNPADAGTYDCLTSTPLPDIIDHVTSTCTFSAGGHLTGSFTVKSLSALGAHSIRAVGSSFDFGSATFTVAGPTITLNPISGPIGTAVTVSGSGFDSGDAGTYDCFSSTPLPDVVDHTTSTCTFSAGGSMTGSFTIKSGAIVGGHTITAQGLTVDSASATFVVTSSAPTIVISPAAAPSGVTVTITASGFASSDTKITFSSTPGGLTMNGGATTSCTVSPGGSGKCTFSSTMVGTAGISYTITGKGNVASDTAKATYAIPGATPGIIITPSFGPPGTLVSVAGTLPVVTVTDPAKRDTTCSINGISTDTSSCQIVTPPSANFYGSFVVGSGLSPGVYSVRVTGSGCTAGGSQCPTDDFVEATFTVTGPQIVLSPSSGRIGITVSFTGSGFSFASTSCTLDSSGSLINQGACSINGGTGTPSGSFLVANVAPGTYTVKVTGSQGEFAEATFMVLSGPTIVLTPTSGQPGVTVIITGSGFLPQDSSCSISGTPVQNQACTITLGTGAPSGSFQVSAVGSGSYTITVSGDGGDSAQAVFTVTVQALQLTLSPTFGSPGTTVSFVGFGLQSTDTSCTVTSTPNPSGSSNGASLITNPSCSVSAGTATGSFVVNSLATADGSPWTVTVTGNPVSDRLTAQFTLIPAISVTPNSGSFGAVVTISGNGFSSQATTCSLHSAPLGLFKSGTDACSLIVPGPSGDGQVSGTFTVASSLPAGSFVVTATDNKGKSASTTFTLGTPTADVTISPNSITPPISGTVTVGVTGFGFNPVDTGCSVAVSAPITVAGTCSMSGGSASATLNVPAGATSGLYLVTVTGTPNGDFASNYLAVGAITTATATTSTTTTSTTATTTSTTTSSTNTLTSQSTTTMQTTGFSTWIFTSKTVTTTSAQSTTTMVSTVFSSSTFTTTFTTTVQTTFTKTFGQIIQPAGSSGFVPDEFGFIALLLFAVPFLFRRLTR